MQKRQIVLLSCLTMAMLMNCAYGQATQLCTPYSAEACRYAARRLGLPEGGGYPFEGQYAQKGCYAYSSGYYAGRAFYGLGGSDSEIRTSTTKSDSTYRPEGFGTDCSSMLVDHVAYEDKLQGWNVTPSECGDLGTILGGKDNTYNNDITKTYDLPMTECSVRIQMEFIKIDTWDHETATVTVNNEEIWSEVLNFSEKSEGAANICGYSHDIHVIDETITVSEDYLEIHVTTTLDQIAKDEAFGIRNVIITPDCATSAGGWDLASTKKVCGIGHTLKTVTYTKTNSDDGNIAACKKACDENSECAGFNYMKLEHPHTAWKGLCAFRTSITDAKTGAADDYRMCWVKKDDRDMESLDKVGILSF